MIKQGADLKKYRIKLHKVWKFYKNLVKNTIRGTIKTLINNGKEITMPNEINLTLKSFYENLFKKDIKNQFLIFN